MQGAAPSGSEGTIPLSAARLAEGAATASTLPDPDRLLSGPGGTVSSPYVREWAAGSTTRLNSFTLDAYIKGKTEAERLADILKEMNGNLVIQASLAKDANDRLDRLLEATTVAAATATRSANVIARLTWVLMLMTAVLVFLTVVLVGRDLGWQF
jgi:hypothetical protein